MKVIASYSIKGGVGKTAASVNLAYAAAGQGRRTLLVDLDPQGASSFYFRVRPANKLKGKGFFNAGAKFRRAIRESDYAGLDVLPANLAFRNFDLWLAKLNRSTTRLRKVLKSEAHDYDLVILDCPPGITLLAENVFNAADLILVPVIPTTLSERTFAQLLGFFEDKGYPAKKLRPFFNLVQRNNRLHRQTTERLLDERPGFFKHSIPASVDIERMGLMREPALAYAGERPGAVAYRNLCSEILAVLGH